MKEIIFEWIIKIVFCVLVIFVTKTISNTYISGLIAGDIYMSILWMLDSLKKHMRD